MKLLRRALILSHRWLGIGACLLAVMWFGTGIVMMYAGGMPRLTPELRLERLPALELAAVRLSPLEAADRLGVVGDPGRMSLTTVMGRPAYRVAGQTVFADTGELLGEIGIDESRLIASRFAGVPIERAAHVETLTRNDQWTLLQGSRMPLHKFAVDDGVGTEVYVSPGSAEVVQMTTSRGRLLAWLGTIPHWMYFTALRLNQPLWYRIVVWTSALVCAVAVLGLALAIVQFRRRTPFSLRAAVPYAGAMRWHYITGAVFGVFTLTWAFSGLLSMEPFAWTNATGLEVPRDAFTSGPPQLARFDDLSPARWESLLPGRVLKEIEFVRLQDDHVYVARSTEGPIEEPRPERLHQPYYITGRSDPNRALVSADTMRVRDPFTTDSLMTRLRAAAPDAPVAGYELLAEYDSYYYSRGGQKPLPVLRVRFEDPAETWVYVDPQMSEVLARINRLNRVERWLYNGLHSLDFAFWYNRRPLWDIGMIVLLLGGLASSGLGAWMGMRRLWRGAARPARGWSGAPEMEPAPGVRVDSAR